MCVLKPTLHGAAVIHQYNLPQDVRRRAVHDRHHSSQKRGPVLLEEGNHHAYSRQPLVVLLLAASSGATEGNKHTHEDSEKDSGATES